MHSHIPLDLSLKIVLVSLAIATPALLLLKYLTAKGRDAPKLRAIAILLITYSLAWWDFHSLVYVPYQHGLALNMAIYNHSIIPLSTPGAHFGVVFHTVLAVLLLGLGTWFAIRFWQQKG